MIYFDNQKAATTLTPVESVCRHFQLLRSRSYHCERKASIVDNSPSQVDPVDGSLEHHRVRHPE